MAKETTVAQPRTKSLQNIIDQRTRIYGYEGGRYSTFARQQRATRAFKRYANNMAEKGALTNPNQQFKRKEYVR